MLYDLDAFSEHCSRRVSVDDITMVVAVRSHDRNPWVAERLALFAGHYAPLPATVVVDLGSQGPHKLRIQGICKDAGFEYVYVDDTDTFSLSAARNVGVAHVTSELVFFNDIDCFGDRDMFRRLAEVADALELGACFDQIVNLPCYYLAKQTTRDFLDTNRGTPQSEYLRRVYARACYAPKREVVEFIAPYSNVFLCHRRFFDLIGGFNETFRGHGSEDFEFLLRFAYLSRQFPMPERPSEDHYGPVGMGFYESDKGYKGFRRLFELMGMQAEVSGLRVAHLHHETAVADKWSVHNDRSRDTFRDQVGRFFESEQQLLFYDWLPRRKRALALVARQSDVPRLMALRLAGYRLEVANLTGADAVQRACALLRRPTLDAVAWCDDTGSGVRHEATRHVVEAASAAGLEVITIERGVLPESWEYRSDQSKLVGAVAAPRDIEPTEAQCSVARAYLVGADAATLGAVQQEAATRSIDIATDAQLTAFAAWLLFHRYSFFRAGGVLYAFTFGSRLWTQRASLSRRFDLSSYAAGRLGLGTLSGASDGRGSPGEYGHGLNRPTAHGDVRRRLGKLARDPKRFLDESRFPVLRWVGRHLIK